MEKTITHTKQDVENCLIFIRGYHKLEKGTHLNFQDHVKRSWQIEDSRHAKIEYLCARWKAAKKDFGELWFKLDVFARVKMYTGFKIQDPEAIAFGSGAGERISGLFVSPSQTYNRLFNLMVFFNNHGIEKNPTDWLWIHEPPADNLLVDKNPCYGNSKNWAAFILSLNLVEQARIVETILNNYQLEQYT